MDFKDVDHVLDRRIVFGYAGSLPVSAFSKKVDFPLQSGLHFGEDELELSYFIPEDLAESREIAIFIAKSNAKKHGNLYFVNYSLSSPLLYKAFDSIRSISHSTILDSLLLQNGEYHLSLRFNHKEMNVLSDFIFDLVNEVPELSINYLGKSCGLESILSQISGASELYRFEYEIILPDEVVNKDPFKILGDEWVSENRFMTKSDKVSEIYRTKESISDPQSKGLNVISEEDCLYEYSYSHSDNMLSELHSNAYENRILRFGRVRHYKDGLLRMANVIPRVQAEVMLKVLTKSKEEYPDWKVTLLNIERY